ncbi:MAG: phage tail length tape measure family protein [Proteobacteria bacterium]|nr:phage tail length tape measure family protein [Pseudomonadota bacterium]
MTTDNRKVQLGFEVDATNARAGLDQVKDGARDMARSVVDAGKTAASGMDAIGTGAKRAADSLTREEGRISASIRRATTQLETLGKTASQKLEFRIETQGLDAAKFEPALARLRELEAGVSRTGISAAQTAAALRGVPAQFTDIVTSLQGGQAPLTVLLQQGGQLKDMFGGIGPAARALGGFVAGLVTPFTVAAGALGVFAFAAYRGMTESDELKKQIILTGNAAGVTAGQLAAMADATSASIGSQAKAAEALGLLVATGRVAGDQINRVKDAVVSFSSASGASIGDLVKEFAELGKSPTESIQKLSDKYRFLTQATYEQIAALERQGRISEASALAQKTLADVEIERAGKVKESVNGLAKAWDDAGIAVSRYWRSLTQATQDLPIAQQIARLEEQRDKFARSPGFNPGKGYRQTIREFNEQIQALRDQTKAEQEAAKAASDRQQREERGVAATKALEEQRKSFASKAQQEAEELRKYRQNLDAIRAANPSSALLDAKQIAQDEANIRDKYADKGAARKAESEAKKAQDAIKKALDLVDDLSAKQDGFAANYGEQVALLSNAMRAGAISSQVYGRAMELLLQRQPFAIEQTRRQAEEERKFQAERKQRFDEIQREYEQEVRAAEQSAKGVESRVQAMADEEAAIARSRALNISLAQALEDVAIARLEVSRGEALGRVEQERADAITREIGARRELARLTERKGLRDGADSALDKLLKADVGTNFAAGFDKASASLGTFVESFDKLIKAQEEYNLARKSGKLTDEKLAALNQNFNTNQLNSYAALTGAAKGFFKEQSAGYKALQTAESVLRALELASSVERITMKMAEGQALAAVGVANQASGDPYTAPARMAAMAAIMAGLGFAVSGAFGGSSYSPVNNTGTGTVFGDPGAQSESIKKSIDTLSDIDTLTARYSAQMAASLRSIEGNIGGLANILIRSGGLDAASAGIQTGFKPDAIGKVLGSPLGGMQALSSLAGLAIGGPLAIVAGGLLGGLFSKTLGGLFGSKTSIVGQGLTANAQAIGSILDNGFDASYFTDTQTKKKTFGFTTSTKYRTFLTDADPVLERQIGTIFGNFSAALLAASEPLKRNLDQVSGSIRGFVVDIGRVDLKGLSGEQISERLTAVFGAQGDRLASVALGGLEGFQRVGEGYLETVVRTASGVEQATIALRRFGITTADYNAIANKQGDVGAELVRDSLLATEALGGVADILRSMSGDASEIVSAYSGLTAARLSLGLLGLNAQAISADLLQGAGGLQDLTDSLKAFEEGFFTQSEQVSFKTQRLAADFQRFGLALPSSGVAFKALVQGIDTTTESGRVLLGNVLALSGGFSDLLDALQSVGSGIQSEIERIRGLGAAGLGGSVASLQAQFAISTAQARAGDQAAIDALPKLSQALLKASETQSASALEFAAMQASTLRSLEETLAYITDPTRRLATVRGFASGGDFAGGLRLVGERGPELEVTGPARIFDAATTQQILNGGGNAELLSEMRALRASLDQMRSDQVVGDVTLARNTGQLVTLLNRVIKDGDRLSVTTS